MTVYICVYGNSSKLVLCAADNPLLANGLLPTDTVSMTVIYRSRNDRSLKLLDHYFFLHSAQAKPTNCGNKAADMLAVFFCLAAIHMSSFDPPIWGLGWT